MPAKPLRVEARRLDLHGVRGEVVRNARRGRLEALRHAEPERELLVVPRRPHRHRDRLAADPDLERLLDGDEIDFGRCLRAGERSRPGASSTEAPSSARRSRGKGTFTLVMRSVRLLTAFGLGYLLGTVPSADIVSRVVTGGRIDLRKSGSRNPGAVNAGRVLGATPGRAVMVADVAKGYASGAGGQAIAGDLGAHVAGVAAVVGHCYPVVERLRRREGARDDLRPVACTRSRSPRRSSSAWRSAIARIPGLRNPGLVATTAAATHARWG